MASGVNESLANLSAPWSRLMLSAAQKIQSANNIINDGGDGDASTRLSAVERQTENSRKGGTIWEAVRKADETAFKRLIKDDPKCVDARGPVGECPIHMLYIYGTDAHMNMARYLIAQFPHTLTQIYNLPVSSIELTFLLCHLLRIARNTTARMCYTLLSSKAMHRWWNGC